MNDALIYDPVRTAIGCYAGGLATCAMTTAAR